MTDHMVFWKNGIAGVDYSAQVFKMDPATGAQVPLDSDLPPDITFHLFNVGDSLFATTPIGDRLFQCQAGSERWIPVGDNGRSTSRFVGFSPFGITRLDGDSVFWSRDYGKTWRPYPAPLNPRWAGIVPEENRLWVGTNPMQRMELNGNAWIADIAGMQGVTPWDLGSNGNRLFANSDGVWYQSASPDSAWKPESEPEGIAIQAMSAGHSVLLESETVSQDSSRFHLLRIDADGKRTVYPDVEGSIRMIIPGSRDRIFASFEPASPLSPESLKVASPTDPSWTELRPTGGVGGINSFAMDGDRIVASSNALSSKPGFPPLAIWPPFYSADGGNTWDTCAITGHPQVTGLAFTGGAFLAFTENGVYRTADPRAGWNQSAFQGELVDMLAANGDTVVAKDSARLLLTVDGGRTWSSAEAPYDPREINKAVLAWSSICLIDAGNTDRKGVLCGSLSALNLKQVDGIVQVTPRGEAIRKLRLNWGRIEGPLPGGRGTAISAGVDGRIRPALRAR